MTSSGVLSHTISGCVGASLCVVVSLCRACVCGVVVVAWCRVVVGWWHAEPPSLRVYIRNALR